MVNVTIWILCWQFKHSVSRNICFHINGPEVLFQDLRRDEIRGWWWWWWLTLYLSLVRLLISSYALMLTGGSIGAQGARTPPNSTCFSSSF